MVVARHRTVGSVLHASALALLLALALWAPQAIMPVRAAVPTFPFQASPVFVPPSLGPDYKLTSLTIGPDGRPWFAEGHPIPSCNSEDPSDPGCHYDGHLKGKIGRLNPDGTMTEFGLPDLYSLPTGLVSGSDGNLWFVDQHDPYLGQSATIGRMTPSGQVDVFQFSSPPPNHGEFGVLPPNSLTLGPDGNIYFTANYGGNQATNGVLGQITPQGVMTYIPLFQNNFVFNFGGEVPSIASVGGVLWFGGSQYDNCLTCFPAAESGSINYYVPSTGILGGYAFLPNTRVSGIIPGPGDGTVWMEVGPDNIYNGLPFPPSPVAIVDRMGRVTFPSVGQFGGYGGLVAGSDNRVYAGGGISSIDGVSRIDETGQTSEAVPIPGSSFAPRVLDASGTLWGMVSTGGIQSFKNLDGAGPAAPALGPATAAFTATQSLSAGDGTGNANVTVDLNGCASGGAVAGYNWTVGAGALIPESMCDLRTQIPVGDVSVNLGVSGVPGGPPLSSVTQTVHTVPHASFSHLVDKTHTNSPTVRVLLNPCQASGAASYQWTVLDQTYGTYLTATPTGDPASPTCQYWYVDLNPGFPYSITLTVIGPASTNGAQDSATSIVMEQMQPVFTFGLDQVEHGVANANIHFDACSSIGVGAYEWTIKNPAGGVVAHSAPDATCQRDLTAPLHTVATDLQSPYAYYILVLTGTSGLATGTSIEAMSMVDALASAPTFEGCQLIAIGPGSCVAQLGDDIWSSLVGAKRPPDFVALNVGIPISPLLSVSGGVAFACDGSTYITVGLTVGIPLGKTIDGINAALKAALTGPVVAASTVVAFGWVGNPEDAAPPNAQIDDFLGPGPIGYQIGVTIPGVISKYFLLGSVFGQNQFGLMEDPGLKIDLGVGIGAAVDLGAPLVPGSTCTTGAVVALERALQAGIPPTLLPFGAPQAQVNLSTATSPLTVAPGQTVGVTASGFTPATQFGATLHSNPITLGIGTTDAGGNVSFSFQVPADLPAGTHRLIVDGWSQGQVRELAVTLIVGSRTLTGSGASVSAAEGSSFSGPVASFTDTSGTDAASDFTASIAWGDGSTSTGAVSGPAGGPFAVAGAHRYAEEASLNVTTTLTHTSSAATAAATSTAAISDPGVHTSGSYQVSSVEGSDSGLQKVATFTDPAGAEPNASDPTGTHYVTAIQWGDGTSSAGVITGPDAAGVLTVSGSHNYAEEGSYQLAVTVHHEGAADATAAGNATVKPRSGEILFSRASTADGADHHSHIWVMNPDGTNAHALSSGNFNDTEPVWSPDGTRIVFTSSRNGLPHIFVMNADGTGVIALTSGSAFDVNPTWSPDGTRIAFTSTRGGLTHIYVVSATGGAAKALTSGSSFDATPAWSPDGSHIAFSSTRAGSLHIFVMKSDGTAVAPLTSGSAIDTTPSWSPDGTHIAFTSSRGGNTHIYSMQSNGAAVTALTAGAAFDALPVWSPDGSHIAFTSTRAGWLHIFAMNADGSSVSALGTGLSIDASPSWRAAE